LSYSLKHLIILRIHRLIDIAGCDQGRIYSRTIINDYVKDKLHNEGLHNLYSSSSIIRMVNSRRMRWAGHIARMGEKRNPYRILVGKPEGKRPLGSPRRRWVDNIIR
jgi:hypothetical protein